MQEGLPKPEKSIQESLTLFLKYKDVLQSVAALVC